MESRVRAIDRAVPQWHHRERHQRGIAASPAEVLRAVRGVTGPEVRLLGPLMALRELPRLTRSARRLSGAGPLLEAFRAEGFGLIADEPAGAGIHEIALGAVGRFWRPAHNGPLAVVEDAEGLRADRTPNAAKAAFDLRVVPLGEGTLLTTETRVVATDERSRRPLAVYWTLIRPFSGAIRRSWLAAIERRARTGDRAAGLAGPRR